MGNSYSSNHKHVIKSLVGKIDGIPIWPPVKKLLPLDIVVVSKDGSVRSLDLKADHLQNLTDKEKKKLQELRDNMATDDNRPAIELSDSTDKSAEARASLIHSFVSANAEVSTSKSKDLSISMENVSVTAIAPKDNENDAMVMLKETLSGGAKIDELYNRHKKYIFVITEVTNTTGFSVAYSDGGEVGLDVEVFEQGVGFQVASKNKTSFEASDTVTVAIKALRFDVFADGSLGNAKRVAIDRNRVADESDENVNKIYEQEVVANCDENEKQQDVPIPVGKKVALLIGNDKYRHMRSLRGCGNDVDSFGKYLSDRGFETEELKDLDYDEMLRKMDEYLSTKNVRKGDMLVFYYAGHGSVRRADDGDEFAIYEQTICPIDSSRTKANRDIPRDVIQAWVGKMESMGVKVLLFFDSCHSGGIIREDDEDKISDDCRASRGDDRPILKQDRPLIPDYEWLQGVKNGESVQGAFENVAWLAACKNNEFAKEISGRGAMTKSLVSILEETEKEEGKGCSFREIMEKVQEALKKQDVTQNPDISGNVDTVAFCIQNLMKLAPFPYYLVTTVPPSESGVMKMKFHVPPILPLITVGSKFALYHSGDSNMKAKLATIEIDRISRDNTAHARICDDDAAVGSVFPKQQQMLRAVEIQHKVGARRHYVGVSVEGNCNELQQLKEILGNLKGRMFKHRNDFPVKVLPPTSLIVMDDSDIDHGISVQLSDDNVLSITNEEGNLVCPRVEVRSHYELNLAASYIASYAHWNMMRTLSNPSTKLTNKINIVIKGLDDYGYYDRVLIPNERGEYELDWGSIEKTSEPFTISAEIDDLDESCALMLVELDINYGVYHHMEYFHEVKDGSRKLVLTKGNYVDLPIEDIAKDSGCKWCAPLFEWKLFIVKVPGEEENWAGFLAEEMGFLESEGIQKASHGIELDAEDNRKSVGGRIKPGGDWTCIPIKFRHTEIQKYAREGGRNQCPKV